MCIVLVANRKRLEDVPQIHNSALQWAQVSVQFMAYVCVCTFTSQTKLKFYTYSDIKLRRHFQEVTYIPWYKFSHLPLVPS